MIEGEGKIQKRKQKISLIERNAVAVLHSQHY